MTTLDSTRWLEQRSLWLVPRAETTWEAAGRPAGHDERPLLTARGMHQARHYAQLLASSPVTRVIAADLRADLQSARPLARSVGAAVTREPRLRGRSLGLSAGAPFPSLPPRWAGVEDGVVVDADAAPPGGESVREVYRRVSRFLAELLGGELDGDVALVADRDALAVAMAWLDGAGPGQMPWPVVRDDLVVGRSVAVRVPVPLRVDALPAMAVPVGPASDGVAAPTLSYA